MMYIVHCIVQYCKLHSLVISYIHSRIQNYLKYTVKYSNTVPGASTVLYLPIKYSTVPVHCPLVYCHLHQGFRECRKHIKDEQIISAFLDRLDTGLLDLTFLDRTLCSRLGIRMLVTHHLLLQVWFLLQLLLFLLLQEPKSGHIGIVNLCVNLRDVVQVQYLQCTCNCTNPYIQRWINFVVELCEDKYGHCPTIK